VPEDKVAKTLRFATEPRSMSEPLREIEDGTLEDVIEELVGEIREGHRFDQEQMFVPRGENSWLVDGSYSISDLLRQLDMRVEESEEPRGYSTISGLILHQLGRIPSIGDTTQWSGLNLEVVDMDGQRIDRVLVSRPAAQPT